MLESDKAYIAGIVDGEGCIAIVHKRQLILKIAMNDKDIIKYLSELLGCNYSTAKITSAGNQCWQLQISGYHAKSVLRDILPYLIGKQTQAELALMFPLGVQHNNRSLTDEMVSERIRMANELSSMHSGKGK